MSNRSYFQAQRISYFQQLFETNPKLFETDNYASIIELKTKGSKVHALLPLKDHPNYGETALRLIEKIDASGFIEEFHYGWEYSQRLKRKGKSTRHELGKRKSTNVQDLDTARYIY
jgi:hypothetical protein